LAVADLRLPKACAREKEWGQVAMRGQVEEKRSTQALIHTPTIGKFALRQLCFQGKRSGQSIANQEPEIGASLLVLDIHRPGESTQGPARHGARGLDWSHEHWLLDVYCFRH